MASRANTTLWLKSLVDRSETHTLTWWLKSHVWRCVGHIPQMYMCVVASRANTTLCQLRSQVDMCVCVWWLEHRANTTPAG
eukprot:6485217-Amphidinium_carterae.1